MRASPRTLEVVDAGADDRFRLWVRELFPDSHEWEERYVEHEISHVGPMLTAGLFDLEGASVLEFGCHTGATAIVLAHHGAEVTAVDVNSGLLELAALNAQRYGVSSLIQFRLLTAGQRLPFADAVFGAITCNSVLEYVARPHLTVVLDELDRVLRPGGFLLVFGTSNALWPIEVHSRRWLVNYVPVVLDRWLPRPIQRGVSPWRLRRRFASYRNVMLREGAAAYISAKRAMGLRGWKVAALRIITVLGRPLGVTPGILTPSMTLLLRKPG